MRRKNNTIKRKWLIIIIRQRAKFKLIYGVLKMKNFLCFIIKNSKAPMYNFSFFYSFKPFEIVILFNKRHISLTIRNNQNTNFPDMVRLRSKFVIFCKKKKFNLFVDLNTARRDVSLKIKCSMQFILYNMKHAISFTILIFLSAYYNCLAAEGKQLIFCT